MILFSSVLNNIRYYSILKGFSMEDVQINDRVKQIRLDRKKTQQEFANDLNITQGNLSLIESGKTIVTLQTIKLIRHKFDVTYDWLIDGINSLRNTNSLIPLIDKSAMGGYPADHGTDDYEKSLALYRIPGFDKGDHRIFEIESDSMLPTLLPHENVVAAKIVNREKLVDGSLCIIVTKDEVLAKRLYQAGKKKYRLECDNTNYKPIEFQDSEILEIWGVIAKITQSFQKPMSMADEKVETLQDEMDQLKKEIAEIKNSISRK